MGSRDQKDESDIEEIESSRLSFAFTRSLLTGDYIFILAYFKRQAVTALVPLGEDPLTLCTTYLNVKGYNLEPIYLGVADVLRAHQERISPEACRDLIERGLKIGKVETRKAFYQLGADLFSRDFLERAKNDTAKSIREWATKLLSGEVDAPKRRGRGKKKLE